MERPENLTTTNTKYLLWDETELKMQTAAFGRQNAKAGIPTVLNNLERLIQLAKSEKTATFVPADFLENASYYLWETGTDIDSIFAMYKKWLNFDLESIESDTLNDTIGEIQVSYPVLAAKLTTEEKDPRKKRQTLLKSVEFMDKNTVDDLSKVECLIYYGKYLFENGMEVEGRQIIKITSKSNPDLCDLLDFQETIKKIK